MNIHDVVLATEFLPSIVGLSAGAVVYDGPAKDVDHAVLTRVYGAEDWTAITQRLHAVGDAAPDSKDAHRSALAAA